MMSTYMLSSLKCLGVISTSDDNWPSVVSNIREDRKKWAKLSRILGREGVDAKTLGVFYKPLVQVVLLFILDIWVMTLRIFRAIGVFHHWVSRWLIGKKIWRVAGGNCVGI